MPVTNGTSFKGLQLLGVSNIVPVRSLIILIPGSQPSQRTRRLGTVLVCYRQPGGTFPVDLVWKLYAHGMAVGRMPNLFNAQAEIWVNWFVQAIAWTCVTPDV